MGWDRKSVYCPMGVGTGSFEDQGVGQEARDTPRNPATFLLFCWNFQLSRWSLCFLCVAEVPLPPGMVPGIMQGNWGSHADRGVERAGFLPLPDSSVWK